MPRDRAAMKNVGWDLEVDMEEEKIYLEHADSGATYVLDSEGGIRVPGHADIDHDLEKLREKLTSAITRGEDSPAAMTDGGQPSACNIECDETTGEVTIESDTDISLKSKGTISLDASSIDMSTDGNTSIDSSGVLTLQGSLIKLN